MSFVALAPVLLIVVLVVGGILVARRSGYNMGGEVVVRCREGHLFTTI